MFTYDPRHRVATAKDALLRTDSYVYDHAGNLTSFTDRKGQVTIFTYDSQNRRSQATYHNSTKTKWTYDAGNRVTLIEELVSHERGAVIDRPELGRARSIDAGSDAARHDHSTRMTRLTAERPRP